MPRTIPRMLRRGGVVVGYVLLFAVALVAGVLTHLGTPPARRLVMTQVNSVLVPSFQGKITIRRIGGLGLFGLEDTDATIDDPSGKEVLSVHGARVGLATLAAARSALLGGKNPLTIDLTGVAVDSLDVCLDTDPQGQLELLNAFESRAPPLDVELDGFRGGFTYAPEAIEGDVANAKVTARRIANRADIVGSLQAHVKMPADPKVHPDGRLAWDGTVGEVAQSIRASFVKDAIDAVVDVPETTAAAIRSVWAASAIEQSARVHVEAHGTLAGVDVSLHAGIGPAAFDTNGHLVLEDQKTGKLTLQARDIDVHEIAASTPRSKLGLTGDVFADMKADGALSGDVAMRFLGGTLGAETVPTACIHATISWSAAKELRGHGEIVVDEPGAPTQLTVQLSPQGDSSIVDFKLDSHVDDFQRVPQLAHSVFGKARLSATGRVDTTKNTIAAQLEAHAAGIARGSTRVESASVEARVDGALEAPQAEATMRARGVLAGGRHFVSADVALKGVATAPHVTASVRGPDTPDVDAGVDVVLQGGVSLERLRVVLARAGERSVITAREVKIAGGDVSVDDARVEGVGAPLTATVSMTPATMRVQAATKGIDLGRVARLAHIEKSLEGGTVAFDADLHLKRGAGEGKVTLDASNVSAGQVKNVTAHLDLTLAGRKVRAKARADVPGVLVLDLDAPKVVFVGSGALTASAWKKAFGSLDVDVRADLAKLASLIPPEDLPLSEAAGDVVLKAHLARDDLDDVTPDVTLAVTTDKLALAPRVSMERDIDGVLVHPQAAWRLAGVDFAIDGDIGGRTGSTKVSTKAHDAKGALAQVDASTEHFPYADVLNNSVRLKADLLATDFDVHLVVPGRGLGSMPPMLRQDFVSGRLQADVTMKGTILTPTVDLRAGVRQSSFAGNVTRTPLDFDLSAHYDGKHGKASVKARTAEQELLDLETQIEAVASQFVTGEGGSPAWTASARAHLASFPLQSIAALDDKLVSGTLSGDISLDGLHDNARADARLSVDHLSVGSVGYKEANVTLKADGHRVDGTIRIDQSDGFAEVKAHAMASWGAAIAPLLDPTKPLDATLSAKNFRIAALLPFVDGVLDELDGRLDSTTRLELDPAAKTARWNGTMDLTRGTFESPEGGGELHDVTANVRFAPDGTITLEKLTAAGLSGTLQASGVAHLQGTTLQSAYAAVTIPSNAAIPLTAGGSLLGDVDGRFDITASSGQPGSPMAVKVDVPQLNVKLPEASTGNPESLGPMAKVRIGAHRGDPARFVLLPLDGTKKDTSASKTSSSSGVAIKTHLSEVHVVRGTQLAIDLEGNVGVSSGAASKVTGQILLKKGGTLDIQGRTFTIDNGTVTFVGGDPSNPQIVVKASWTATDGTVVYATFTGPLKTGKVTLTSQPQLPKNEIVQLLLFGSADGTQAQTPTSSTENTAIATAGGEAAQPLNHMLNQLGLGAVTAKVDTSQASNPKPEVEVQIAKELSVEIAIVLGQPPPGVNPDTTLLTLDWRFLSMWSLSTTVGNAGTTIFDVLWQRRY